MGINLPCSNVVHCRLDVGYWDDWKQRTKDLLLHDRCLGVERAANECGLNEELRSVTLASRNNLLSLGFFFSVKKKTIRFTHLEQIQDSLVMASINDATIIRALDGVISEELFESCLHALDKFFNNVAMNENI